MLGVSFDSVAKNRAFAEREGYPYRLLSDPERRMGLAFGACDRPDAGSAKRYTFVVGPDGRIEQAIATRDPLAQADELLRSIGG